MLLLLATIVGFFSLPTAFAFTWDYPVAPRQCSNFTVVVTGTNVVFPLTVLIVPVGPSPLAHEVRKVMEVPFPTNATTLNFQLPYPKGSKFVGLVSTAFCFIFLRSSDRGILYHSLDLRIFIKFYLLIFMFTGNRCFRLSWHCQHLDGATFRRCVLLWGRPGCGVALHLFALSDRYCRMSRCKDLLGPG